MVRLLHTGLQDSDVIQKLQGQLDQALRMIVQLQKGNQQNGVSPAGGGQTWTTIQCCGQSDFYPINKSIGFRS